MYLESRHTRKNIIQQTLLFLTNRLQRESLLSQSPKQQQNIAQKTKTKIFEEEQTWQQENGSPPETSKNKTQLHCHIHHT
jgi:hypothetical protein